MVQASSGMSTVFQAIETRGGRSAYSFILHRLTRDIVQCGGSAHETKNGEVKSRALQIR